MQLLVRIKENNNFFLLKYLWVNETGQNRTIINLCWVGMSYYMRIGHSGKISQSANVVLRLTSQIAPDILMFPYLWRLFPYTHETFVNEMAVIYKIMVLLWSCRKSPIHLHHFSHIGTMLTVYLHEQVFLQMTCFLNNVH